VGPLQDHEPVSVHHTQTILHIWGSFHSTSLYETAVAPQQLSADWCVLVRVAATVETTSVSRVLIRNAMLFGATFSLLSAMVYFSIFSRERLNNKAGHGEEVETSEQESPCILHLNRNATRLHKKKYSSICRYLTTSTFSFMHLNLWTGIAGSVSWLSIDRTSRV